MNETRVTPSQMEKSPVIKALRMLTHLAESGEPLALADLSRALNLPKPTGYRLAQALVSAGFVQKDPLTNRYLIGANFEHIALNALKHGAGHSSRRLLMNQLADRLGARVNFTLLKSGNLSFVEWVDSTAPLRVDIRADAPMPVHGSASGKLLLAFGPEELQAHFLRTAPYERFTDNTITSAEGLDQEMKKIRKRGHSEDNEELLPGVVCVAVPVRNRAGMVIAGLAVMSPTGTMSLKELRAALPVISECADKISLEIIDAQSAANSASARRRSAAAAPSSHGRPANEAAPSARARG